MPLLLYRGASSLNHELRAVTGHSDARVQPRYFDFLGCCGYRAVIRAAYMLMFSRNNNNALFSLLGHPGTGGHIACQAGISRDRETSADHDGAINR